MLIFFFRLFDISVLHASMIMMNVCLSDAYRAEPANTICLDDCVISAHTEPQTDFNSITFDFIKLLNSLRSHLITQSPLRSIDTHSATLDFTTKITNNAAFQLS